MMPVTGGWERFHGRWGMRHDGAVQDATQAAPLVGDECLGLAEGASQVTFTDAHGGKLGGAVFGAGSTGVVLSHMSDGAICGWMPYARQLAAGGYRVLVYYFHGYGPLLGGADGSSLDGDVIAAAGYLRRRCTTPPQPAPTGRC